MTMAQPHITKRAAAVKQAHAELSKTPGFRDLPPHQQFKATQAHVNKQGKKR